MTTTYKVLGQLATTANTEGNIYVVPAANSAVISSITVCNQAITAATYSILVKVANAATTTKQYLVYQSAVPGNDTVFLTLGITLGAGDVLAANVNTSTVSINSFGSEIY